MGQAGLLSNFRVRSAGNRSLAINEEPEYDEDHSVRPVPRRASSKWRSYLAALVVISPTIWAAVYYGLIASDRYVSETQFIVRGLENNRATGLDAVFRTFGIARTADDSNAVSAYLQSRDALSELQAKLPMKDIFTRPGSDIFSRYPHIIFADTFERMYDYFQERTFVVPDSDTGVTTLRVEAYRPEDAQAIARQLLIGAEALVNRMNDRARSDAISAAQIDVDEARAQLVDAQTTLTAFRNSQMMIDPNMNSASQLETITGLTTSLGQALAQRGEGSKTAPNNPGLNVLRARAESLKAQIDAERAKIGGDETALAVQVSKFERLTMLRDLSEKSFAAAVSSLESARQDARRRQIYLEEIVQPNLADQSTRPERIRGFASVLFVSLALLSIGWLMSVGVREHTQ